MGCGEGVTRFLIGFVNFCLLAFGLAMLIGGIILKTNLVDFDTAFWDELKKAADVLVIGAICLGAFITVISFFGCAGACSKNSCMLTTYGVLVAILFLAQIAVVIACAVYFGKNGLDDIKKEVNKAMKNYDESLTDEGAKAWAHLFDYLECCGAEGGADQFPNANLTKKHLTDFPNAKFPVSCCTAFDPEDDKVNDALFDKDKIKQCMKTVKGTYYSEGCVTKIDDWISDHKVIVIGVGIAVLVVQLLVIIAACVLARQD